MPRQDSGIFETILAPAGVQRDNASSDRIRDAGFSRLERDWVVPDSGYTTLAVADGGPRVERRWHEYLMPGFGGDLNTDADYRAFIRTWKQTRGAIGTLTPVELHRLEEAAGGKDNFRGYVIAAPEKTAWRP